MLMYKRDSMELQEYCPTAVYAMKTEYSPGCVQIAPDNKDSLKLHPKNVPEKIIICLDLSTDQNCTPYKLDNDETCSPLALLKKAILLFMCNKHTINPNHEYALLVLMEDRISWLCDFTTCVKDIATLFDDLEVSDTCDTFDFSLLFSTILEHVTLPTLDTICEEDPPYIVRSLVFYARSKCKPVLSSGGECLQKKLLNSPLFVFDLLYVHEPINDDNETTCKEIFKGLCCLLSNSSSYEFDVARNATKLLDCTSKFLAHALQRPAQHETDYKLIED